MIGTGGVGSGSGIGLDLGCKDAPGQLVPLDKFTYNNTRMGCLIQRSIQDVAFVGVSVSSNLQHKLHEMYTGEIENVHRLLMCTRSTLHNRAAQIYIYTVTRD